MSKLSPYVRNAIDAGTACLAVCEEIHLGLATVRLGGTGARLTNLACVSPDVEAGDQVVVDYAAGTSPIVRPLTVISEELDELPRAEPLPEPPEVKLNTGVRANLVCFNRQWENDGAFLPLVEDIPLKYPFNQAYWDPPGMMSNMSSKITVKQSGYYLIHFTVCEPVNCYEIWTYPTFQLPVKGYYGCYRVRVLKNNEPILDEYHRVWESWPYNQTSIEGTLIDELLNEDILELEMTLVGWYFDHQTPPDPHYYYDVCYPNGWLNEYSEANKHVLAVELILPLFKVVTLSSVPAYTFGAIGMLDSKHAYTQQGEMKNSHPAYLYGRVNSIYLYHAFTKGGLIPTPGVGYAHTWGKMNATNSKHAFLRAPAEGINLQRQSQFSIQGGEFAEMEWMGTSQGISTEDPPDLGWVTFEDYIAKTATVQHSGTYEMIVYMVTSYIDEAKVTNNGTTIFTTRDMGNSGGWVDGIEAHIYHWTGNLTAGDELCLWIKNSLAFNAVSGRFMSYASRWVIRRVD